MNEMSVSASVGRSFRLVDALAGYVFDGRSLKELADAVEQSPSTTLRDLQALSEVGIAERIPGRDRYWRLGPRLIRVAQAHQHEMTRMQQRLDEVVQRYSRIPN